MKKNNNNQEIIIGTYSQGKGDFGFVDVEGITKGYFVFGKNKNGALDGDKVSASVKIFKGKQEAVIEKVIERKQDLIVGEYKDNKNFGFVIPKNKQIGSDIFVTKSKSNNAKNGDIVGVLVTNWTRKNPEGTIKEIIGKKGEKQIDLLSIIVEGGARLKFSKEVLSYLNKFGDNIPEHVKLKRKDLRNLFTFTIDGEDAKDLDDAISIEKIKDKYKLYVHIADVTHYVQEKSEVDIEAYKRATSIYLVDRVIPMLPEKLSNNLCSLNPNTDKLALTCEMIFDKNGKIIEQKVYESLINCNFRLTYKDVDQVLNNKIKIYDNLYFGQSLTKELFEKIYISRELKNLISNFKKNNGVLDFDFKETKIILDDNNKILEIVDYPKYESNKIIEEFMISANESVSKYFSKLPFLYRIHEEPKEDDLTILKERLSLFGIEFNFKKADTKEFQKLLEKISKLEESKKIFLEKMILRTLSKAIYSKENFGHFGLGLSFYSHFTSPIRRYPDLQIHRIIKEQLNGKLDGKRLAHYEKILDKVSKHSSDKERKAEKLEYKVKDYFITHYYKDKIGEEFEGIISGVIPKGFFVGLKNSVEGFVEINSSDFDDKFQQHKDLKTGTIYRLGDKINVKLTEVDINLLRLNFKII